MARRDPHPRGRRARGPVAVALAALAALLGGSIAAPLGHAQPAPDPAISRAKDLYKSAEAAMKDGRYDDAARDYGAAYESSKDPALFFKIAHASERAGKCDVALVYYARYLREGKPSEQFVATTRDRIAACGGDVHGHDGSAAPVDAEPGRAAAPGSGSAAPASRASSPAPASKASGAAPAAGRGSAAAVPPGSARAGAAAGSSDVPSGGGVDVAATSGPPGPVVTPSNSDKAAWILGGGAIALITLGGVLAYASSSSENDIRDLYVGFAGQPATFDSQTQKKYNDLIDQGHRYQHLSWAAFGLAGAAAVGSAVLFVIGGRDEPARHARITPLVTTSSAGLAVTF